MELPKDIKDAIFYFEEMGMAEQMKKDERFYVDKLIKFAKLMKQTKSKEVLDALLDLYTSVDENLEAELAQSIKDAISYQMSGTDINMN